MAKRKPQKRKQASSRLSKGRKTTRKTVSGKRPSKRLARKARPGANRKARPATKKKVRPAAKKGRPAARKARAIAKKARPASKRPSLPPAVRLNRDRKTLEESVPTPPSSLNLNRRGSAVRTGRAEVAQSNQLHKGMSSDITGGDVDVDVEDAYFNGDEAPGGDNPTPDQDVVDDIGKALGVEYQDNEELKAADKVIERDRKRWELDPASAEDYKDRK